MKARLDLVSFIEKLCTILNAEFAVAPHLRIVFGDDDVKGACNVLYHRRDMYIQIDLPWKYTITNDTITELTCLITHEYAHYLWSLKLTSEERVNDSRTYLNDATFRRHDEYRTWRQSKKMLRYLGYWNDDMLRAFNTFRYAHVKFD